MTCSLNQMTAKNLNGVGCTLQVIQQRGDASLPSYASLPLVLRA